MASTSLSPPRSRTARGRGRAPASDVQASFQAAIAVPARSHLPFGSAGTRSQPATPRTGTATPSFTSSRPTQTARRLVEASVSENTRRAYAGALRRLDAWLDGRELDDAALATYLAELHDAGRASSSASMAVAAACFRAKLAGQPNPSGERTARVLAGYRRTAGDRGRGQAGPFSASDLAAVLATCHARAGAGVVSSPTRWPPSVAVSML